MSNIHPNDMSNCLSAAQYTRWQAFVDAEIKKIGPHNVGTGPFTLEITPTGIGTWVEVVCHQTGARLDLTEVG